jgi:predicted Zn-dependent protease with MMP-like domain
VQEASEEDRLVEEIYDALDRGDAQGALALSEGALAELADDPVLLFLSGLSLLELDRPDAAAERLQRAVELDPDDAEFRATLAWALFRACRFEEALPHAAAALEGDPKLPDAHAVQGLLLERRGRFQEADRCFARAARLDAERFPPPVRLDRPGFEEEVRRAGDLLPARFRQLLGEVAVSVEELPSEEILHEEHPPLDPELLGLFVGVPLPELPGALSPLPPRVLLFRRNLERHAHDAADLKTEIAITLYHELGHYLGLDEQDLEELDLD